jgi:DNA-binding transcriptional regulator YdaS (Cro superfamily)
MDESQARQPLERAIDAAGGITKLAAALGLSSHAVINQWRLNRVPAEHCPAIERFTRAKAAEVGDATLIVRCEELRPDVAWGVLREQPDKPMTKLAGQGAI